MCPFITAASCLHTNLLQRNEIESDQKVQISPKFESAEPTANCCNQRAHGVVVSHPLRMRKALGSIPSVSMSLQYVAIGTSSRVGCENARVPDTSVDVALPLRPTASRASRRAVSALPCWEGSFVAHVPKRRPCCIVRVGTRWAGQTASRNAIFAGK